MTRPYRILSTTIALILPLFYQKSDALLANGFNITKPSWFFNGVLSPETAKQLPKPCVAAYTTPINCNITILMSPNLVEKNNTLEESCNPECATSLMTFQSDVRAACGGVNLTSFGLDTSWLDAVVDGEAGVLLYWKQCLRDLWVHGDPWKTNKLCEISEKDFRIAWNAASSESATSQATEMFCADNCLTQTVVLNAPTAENLADLKDMCGDIKIKDYPFIDAMVFANLVEDDNGAIVAQGTNTTVSSGSRTSGSDRIHQRIGLELVIVISFLYVLILC